jgi:hypothetical protein
MRFAQRQARTFFSNASSRRDIDKPAAAATRRDKIIHID